jgi:hypothetical protein
MPRDLAELEDCEHEVDVDNENYFRQCHPRFLSDEQPSSQFLGKFGGDDEQLSGTRSSVVSATESFLDYQATGKQTAGTWGVTRRQVVDAGSRLIDDSECPQTDPPRPRGHVYLDFRHFLPQERRAAVSALLIAFHEGGQLAALGDFE